MKKDIKNLNKFTSNFIVSSRGQLDYPGMNTLIPNANGRITMKGVENNVIGIDDLGNKKIMTPEKEYQFPGNSVYEIPLKKRGGQFKKSLVNNPKKTKKDLASKKYSRSLSATNVLFTENFLFKKPKSRKNKIFDPNAKYYAEGGESECPNGQVWSKKDKKCIDLPVFGNSLNSGTFTKLTNLNNALDIKPLNSFSDFGKIKPKKIPVVEDSFLETLEKDINDFLDNPLKKAAQVSESLKEKGEDPSDALRHSTAGALAAQTIANKTGNIPFISNSLGYLGANIAGVGHELSTLSQTYLDDRPWKIKLKESLEDIYNNSAGANTIFNNNSEKDKINYLLKLTRTNQLPDGYGEERPFRDNPKWTDPYNQKQYGGINKFDGGGEKNKCKDGEYWDGTKCTKLISYATDKKFIDGVSNWAMHSVNPDQISSEYNDQIKHYLYSGKYGYDPVSMSLIPLSTINKKLISEPNQETKKILAKQDDKASYTQSIIDAGFDPNTFGKSKGTNVITGEDIYGNKSQEDVDKINKEAINDFVTEGHKKAILDSPFNIAASFTPMGMAAGVMQGGAALLPDAYNFAKDPSWSGAGAIGGDLLMMAPGVKSFGKPIIKYVNNKYTDVAEGSNMFDYAWKSPAARFDKNALETYTDAGDIIALEMPQSAALFDKLKTNPNLTAEELAIIKDYEATSITYKNGPNKEKLDAIIKKSGLILDEPTVMSRRINTTRTDNFNPVNGIFNTKRPTSWSAGRDAVGNNAYSGSADRMVMKLQPGEYDMLKNPYLENSPETLDELRKMYEPMGSLEHRMQFVTGKPRITERELLLGSGADLKQIGKVKNNFGGFDYVMKNLNKKQLGSPNVVSSVDDVVKQPWQMEELPGLHLQSTMEGEAISKIVDKTGKINTEQALAIIAKESGGADKVALIKQGLGETIPKKMDFNDFRKTVQDQLIPLERQFSEQASNYGLGKIGYPSPKRSSFKSAIENNKLEIARLEEEIAKNPKVTAEDIDKLNFNRYSLKLSKNHLLTTEEQFSKLPLENQTLILSNKGKFGTGSSAHGNPEETLGHIHFLRDAQHPDIAIATQMQSDPFQGTHRIMPKVFDKEKELKNLVNLENIAKIQEETAKTAKQISDDIFEFPDGLKIDKTTLENIGKTQKEYNAMKKAEIENFTQKSLLDKNHEERFLQEFMDYAGKRGDLNYIAIPKSETAAKVQGYFKTQKNNANKGDIVTLNNGTTGTIFAKSDNAMVIKHSDGTMENIKLEYVDPKDLFGNMTFPIKNVNGKPFEVHRSYSPEQQTILKKYTEYEKMAKKLGWEIDNITIKGNEYTRIKIPKKFKEGKGEIKAFSTIGTGVLGLGLGATQYKQGGATNDYVDVELTPKEVKDLIAQGYVIEALN